MSFFATQAQFLDRSKTVTRRMGWADAEPGDLVLGIEKGQGLKKGEHQKVFGEILIVDVQREQLDTITKDDCIAEGFPEYSPADFVAMFRRMNKCEEDYPVTRLEFRHVVGRDEAVEIIRRELAGCHGGRDEYVAGVEAHDPGDGSNPWHRVRGLCRVATRRFKTYEATGMVKAATAVLEVPRRSLLGRAYGARLAVLEWLPIGDAAGGPVADPSLLSSRKHNARGPAIAFLCKRELGR